MFYQETWINGKLHWRGTPNGEWIEADSKKLNKRLAEAQTTIRMLELEVRDAARDAAAEERWKERQGEEYGSY